MTNEALRNHVTSVGFQLTLSKAMIDTLIVLDHFKGVFGDVVAWWNGPGEMGRQVNRSYTATHRALEKRGLVEMVMKYHRSGPNKGYLNVEKSLHRVTKAGRQVVGLLKESGLYQDRLDALGLVYTYKDGSTIPVGA